MSKRNFSAAAGQVMSSPFIQVFFLVRHLEYIDFILKKILTRIFYHLNMVKNEL